MAREARSQTEDAWKKLFFLAKTPSSPRKTFAVLAYMDVGQGREQGCGSFASWREIFLKPDSFVKILVNKCF
jgi:hypothetical protein